LWFVEQTGDYATPRFHHIRYATLFAKDRFLHGLNCFVRLQVKVISKLGLSVCGEAINHSSPDGNGDGNNRRVHKHNSARDAAKPGSAGQSLKTERLVKLQLHTASRNPEFFETDPPELRRHFKSGQLSYVCIFLAAFALLG
jgi:hypothetical protein